MTDVSATSNLKQEPSLFGARRARVRAAADAQRRLLFLFRDTKTARRFIAIGRQSLYDSCWSNSAQNGCNVRQAVKEQRQTTIRYPGSTTRFLRGEMQ